MIGEVFDDVPSALEIVHCPLAFEPDAKVIAAWRRLISVEKGLMSTKDKCAEC